jgi:Metal binding domain of Ada
MNDLKAQPILHGEVRVKRASNQEGRGLAEQGLGVIQATVFTLIGADGKPFASPVKGALGGHRQTKIYGRLDCRVALRHVANGTYQKSRVFFADAETALAAGYRACKVCAP